MVIRSPYFALQFSDLLWLGHGCRGGNFVFKLATCSANIASHLRTALNVQEDPLCFFSVAPSGFLQFLDHGERCSAHCLAEPHLFDQFQTQCDSFGGSLVFLKDAIRRPRNTPIWKLEASLKCRSCKRGRSAPPVRMIKLTPARGITPYKWVHLDEGAVNYNRPYQARKNRPAR